MKLLRLALIVALLSLVPALSGLSETAAAPTAGSASVKAHSSACPGSIWMGGKRFAVYRKRVTCTGARTAIRALYASYGRRGTPRGFKCRSLTRFRRSGGCINRTKTRNFTYSR